MGPKESPQGVSLFRIFLFKLGEIFDVGVALELRGPRAIADAKITGDPVRVNEIFFAGLEIKPAHRAVFGGLDLDLGAVSSLPRFFDRQGNDHVHSVGGRFDGRDLAGEDNGGIIVRSRYLLLDRIAADHAAARQRRPGGREGEYNEGEGYVDIFFHLFI